MSNYQCLGGNTMLNYYKNEFDKKTTMNGAVVYETTRNHCLDFFALGGAMRNRSEQDIIHLLTLSFIQDQIKTLKIVFFFGDIRNGQGERRLFKICIKWFAENHPHVLLNNSNFKYIPFYTRWDYLYELVEVPTINKHILDFMKEVFYRDLNTDSPTLLGKWLKSENSSSKETKRLATITRKHFGMNSKQYRKSLSQLRAKIGIVERKMSANEWSEINYEHLPSKAGFLYRNAFYRHDFERYSDYMTAVTQGHAKINAKTLYPYEIVKQSLYSTNTQLLQNYWNNLPDYLKGNSSNALAVIDVSGSMTGTPMDVAISLGLYMAEKNTGAFHNHFITFSEVPHLVEIKGSNICEKVRFIQSSEWGYNTNLERVFDTILRTAVKNNLPQDQIPETLYIISDMQFDCACGYHQYDVLLEHIADKFKMAGYELPHLVFWNVDAKLNTIPIRHGRYSLVSGFSPMLFEQTIKQLDAVDVMNDIIESDRYSYLKL